MKVAVIGATGFIGQHVVARLAREPVDIVCVGRRAESWCGTGRFVPLALEEAHDDAYRQLGSPDVVIHLAWGGLPNYLSLHHFEVELPLQYGFLKKLLSGGLRRLVGVGTCFEYGMQEGQLHEQLVPQPANPYGFAKNALRVQLEYAALANSTQFTWGRLFYLWGQGQAPGSLYPLLRTAVARGERSFDMSYGEQLRDYLPVEEAADRLVRVALHAPTAGVVNICSGRPISVRRLVENWINDNNWDIKLNLGRRPYPDYEPLAFWGDARKLDGVLKT